MVSEEEHSYIEHRNWKRMGVVVQGNVYWLRVKIVNGVEQVAVRHGCCRETSTGGSIREPRTIDEFKFNGADERPRRVDAETHGPKVWSELIPANSIKS